MNLYIYVMLLCCLFCHALADIRPGVGWGGVGWDIHVIALAFSCTYTCTSCYTAACCHAAIRHATLLCVLMHLCIYVMLRCCVFSCTYTCTSCYAAACSHAAIHLRHATLLCVLMHLYIYVLLRCCLFCHALADIRPGVGWGGVGWDIHVIALAFSCTYTCTSCYTAACCHAAIHLRHATLLCVLMHLCIYVMLRCCVFSCTYTCTSCYAAACSHAAIHLRHATLLCVLMHLYIYVLLRCCLFCHALADIRPGVGWGGVGWDIHVIALAFSCTYTCTSCYTAACCHAAIHLRHATLLCVLMHLCIYVMLRCCVFSCTYTCTSCYATACSHAAIHLRHATLLCVLMHLYIYVLLRCCLFCHALADIRPGVGWGGRPHLDGSAVEKTSRLPRAKCCKGCFQLPFFKKMEVEVVII